MQVLDEHTKFAHLGKPGSGFSKGFARRLMQVSRVVDLRAKHILDAGCGEGVWLEQFTKFTAPENIFGSDIDPDSIQKARQKLENVPTNNLKVCPAEALDFPDNSFDIVFSNEVLEHVQDDRKAVQDAIRVLKPGGRLVIFTPNRGWPFEQHGMFIRGKYVWGNIPLLPWLPKRVSKVFAPHVRNYSNGDIKRLVNLPNARIIYHKHVFPGFDGLVRRFGVFGRVIQKLFHFLERTPLHWFGISHFLVVEKAN
jgi:ubiquinone/menaquinone biosynthesis C-methylase UbiE